MPNDFSAGKDNRICYGRTEFSPVRIILNSPIFIPGSDVKELAQKKAFS
jgi:hypothetical protein